MVVRFGLELLRWPMFLNEVEEKMSIVKIEEVFLYASTVADNAAENLQAMAALDHSSIPYIRLIYNDPQQNEEVFNAVNSWWTRPDVDLPPVGSFPFVVYTEVMDNIPVRHSPVKYKAGVDGINEFITHYNSVMNNN